MLQGLCSDWMSASSAQVVRETVETGGRPSQLAFYLDGAHTQESMAACGEWFAAAVLAEDGLPAVTGADGDAPNGSQALAEGRGDSAGLTSLNGHFAAENGGGKPQPRLQDSSGLVAGQNGVMLARAEAAELASANGQNGVLVDRLTHNLLIFNCQQVIAIAAQQEGPYLTATVSTAHITNLVVLACITQLNDCLYICFQFWRQKQILPGPHWGNAT